MPNRRRFIATAAGLGAAAAVLGAPAFAQAKPKLVIVGGGASALRTLWGAARGAIDITLVEPQTVYTTCFYSNLFLGPPGWQR